MSDETTQPAGSDTKQSPTVEDRVERIATYWVRAVVDAWRAVFPRKGSNR